MNPNDSPSSPQSQPTTNTSSSTPHTSPSDIHDQQQLTINQIQNTPTSSDLQAKDDIFIINPPEKKPIDKKAFTITYVVALFGIFLLIGVAIGALVVSAGGLANDYRSRMYTQIKKLDEPLKDYEPSLVLNKRNLVSAQEKISISQAAKPTLDNVLFVGGLSERYQSTSILQDKIVQHYKSVASYTEDTTKMLSFDNEIEAMMIEESELLKTLNSNDSLSLNALSGSNKNYVERVKKIHTPQALKGIKEEIITVYMNRANVYFDWSQAVEAKDGNAAAKSQQGIQSTSLQIAPLVTDEAYISKMLPYYKKLLETQKQLKAELVS
jgi:uncharacterized membrane-anchored protein YhcB (DUF1043 family)